jgi:transcriptional regulator with XRE-family HTH domain
VNTIAERIKAVRQERGWSQAQLAEKVGVAQSSIGNIESGVRQRPRELVSIAKALNVSPDWLETGKGPKRERVALTVVEQEAPPSVRALVERLAVIAAQQRPTLRKNLANFLVDLVEHPEDAALIEQTIADIERSFPITGPK